MKLKQPQGGDDGGGRRLKTALIFGVVAATVQMALVLWFAYC